MTLGFVSLLLLPLICNADPVWFVGFEKTNDACMPVGGLADPGTSPFPFASMDDCLSGNVTDEFDESAEHWEGVVLDNGKCLKVWARAEHNPFVTTNMSNCEKENEKMRNALAKIKGSLEAKRASDTDGMLIALILVEGAITGVALVFPPAALIVPLLTALWPTGTSAWDEVKAQVKDLINQKINEAYAQELEDFINDLKRQLNEYKDYKDASSLKLSLITSIDNSLALRESRFMCTQDPISCLTYWSPYATARVFVKLELLRIAAPSDKQHVLKSLLRLLQRYIAVTGDLAYSKLKPWRLGQLTCKYDKEHSLSGETEYFFTWKDTVTGQSEGEKFDWDVANSEKEATAWCDKYRSPVVNKIDEFIDKLRKNIKAWATIFNKVATNPLVQGFSAADSPFTNEGKCKFPFTHDGVEYNKCTTTVDRSEPWCKKDGDNCGWGYCLAVDKMNVDLTSCKMNTDSSEQYFGHKNVPDNGKPCAKWTAQTKYVDFPMDNQSRELASNYCRRFLKSDDSPWCYTEPSGWDYCTIRTCDSQDWE